jgi:hypothetical protein
MPILTLTDIAKVMANAFRDIGEVILTEPHPTTILQRATPTPIQVKKGLRRNRTVVTAGINFSAVA